MKPIQILRPFILLSITLLISLLIIQLNNPTPNLNPKPNQMAGVRNRSFILWLHGLGDSGPANEPIKSLFTSNHFNSTKWSFPSAPPSPVTCNHGAIMPSWFDIPEIPLTSHSPKDEASLLKAVKNVHTMIDREVASGISPDNIFVCGFSQGGALTLASVLLYPKTLGGGAVFSGWLPFNHSIIEQFPEEAKKTPILWSHGMSDATVLFEAGQEGPPFLERAGVTCEFKAYPGLGHSINTEELKNLEAWIGSRLSSSS
ncbi:hypothetical protein RND81_07G117800 [Saponaria officinalis]|uniref:Phospholipase/carboxylesterase/thioesterase domain-containing protein n=1 Tax=Saponaria officinalis TaxID=3572 RepID=A0AAW1JU36_SAPOF